MNDMDWFHGSLSRTDAEIVLKEHGFEEGLYLVRNSSSAENDFVLSVVHSNEVNMIDCSYQDNLTNKYKTHVLTISICNEILKKD